MDESANYARQYSRFSLVALAVAAALLLLGAPYLLALHQYLYRSPHLWQ